MPTAEEKFGSGIKLTQLWDLQIDASGDLAAVFGLNELEKDIAFKTADELSEEIGKIQTNEARSRIKATVTGVLQDEPRISKVKSVSVTNQPNDTFEVQATVIASRQKQELVIEV